MGTVVRRYIGFLILLIPTPLVLALFAAAFLLLCSFLKYVFHSFLLFIFYSKISNNNYTE